MKGRLGIGGVVLGIGLALTGSSIGGEYGPVGDPKENTLSRSEPSTEEAVQYIRDSFQFNGYDVPKGANGREISQVFYSSSEPWLALLDSNIARGNIGKVTESFFVDQNWRTARDRYWNNPQLVQVSYHALRTGDHLDFPAQIEWNRVIYDFAPVIQTQDILMEIERMRQEFRNSLKPRSSTLKGDDFIIGNIFSEGG